MNGKLSSILNYNLYIQTTIESSHPFLPIETPLILSRFSRSKLMLMQQLISIKLGWWQGDIHKSKELITERPFFHVVKLNSIKVLITLTTQHNLKMQKLYVKTTFLNGYLDEDIYMNIPTPTNLTLVCKLTKSLYGLKQTSCA